MKITVLVSGSGTNLENIIQNVQMGELPNVIIVKVIADRDCKGIERAKYHNIPYAVVQREDAPSENIDNEIPKDTDYIVMAGFLSILSPDFCNKWRNKIINIHPSLLPKYGGVGMYGRKVHEAVLANAEQQSGATVHYVTADVDQGKILLQKAVPIEENETVDSLQAKVQNIEYEIMIDALQMLE